MIAERLRAFVSSRMQELAAERRAVKAALDELEVDAWVFEEDAGARAESVKKTYREQLKAADLYVGIFWRGIGAYTIDEYELASDLGKDRLIYLKDGGDQTGRAPELRGFLDRVGQVETGVTIRWFSSADDLRGIVKKDVARWQTDIVRERQARATESQQQAPTLSDQYIVRPDIMAQLNALLSGGDERVTRVALHGAAGSGKSVVAAAFARDPELPRRFPDGVLWATLGRDGRPLECLSSWGRSLRDPAMSDLGYPSLDAAVRQLRSLLQRRACLLVVDDAWDGDQVREAFLLGGPRCALLLTTREAEVAHKIGARIVDTPPMEPDQAFDLLHAWAGAMQPEDERIARGLADQVGYLPLALELLGAQARKRGSWAVVAQSLERQRLHALKRSRSASGKQDNLEDSFEISLASLSAADRDLYLRLAVFEGNVRFPVSAVAAVWQLDIAEAEELLLELAERALLMRGSRGGVTGYSLQNLMHDFVAERLGAEGVQAAHGAIVAAYRERCSGAWHRLPNDGYVYEHLAHHIAGAGRRDALFALIGREWMEASLRHTGTLRNFVGDLAVLLDAAAGEPVAIGQMLRACLIRATVRAVAENVPVSVIGALARLGEVDRALGFAGLMPSAQQVNALCEIASVLSESGARARAKEILRHAREVVAGARRAGRGDDDLDQSAMLLLAACWEGSDDAAFRAALAVGQPADGARRQLGWLESAVDMLLERRMAPAARRVAEEAVTLAASDTAEPRISEAALLKLARARVADGDRAGGRAAVLEARAIAAAASSVDRVNDQAGVAGVLADIGDAGEAAMLAEEVVAGCKLLSAAWLDDEPSPRLRRDLEIAAGDPAVSDPILVAARALLAAADQGTVTGIQAAALLRASLRVERSWRTQILVSTMTTLAQSGVLPRAIDVGLEAVAVLDEAEDDHERLWLVPTLGMAVAAPVAEPVARAVVEHLIAQVMAVDDDGLKVRALAFMDQWLGRVGDAAALDALLTRVRAGGNAEQLEDVVSILLNLGRLDDAASVAGAIVGREQKESALDRIVRTMIEAKRIDGAAAAAVGIESPEDRASAHGRVASARIAAGDTARASLDVAEALRASMAARGWDWVESEGMVHRQVVGEEHAKGTSLAALAKALAEVGDCVEAERVAGLVDEDLFRGQRMSALSEIASELARSGDRDGALRLVQLARALEWHGEAVDEEPDADAGPAGSGGMEPMSDELAAAAKALINDLEAPAAREALRREIDGRMTFDEFIGDSLRRTLVSWSKGLPSVAQALLEVGQLEEAVIVARKVLDAILVEDPDWEAFGTATEVLGRAGDVEGLDRATTFVRGLSRDIDKANMLGSLAFARAHLPGAVGAAAALDAQAELIAHLEQPYAQTYYMALAAQAAFAAHDPRAAELAAHALEIGGANIDDAGMLGVMQYLVEILADAGDSAGAASTAQRICAASERSGRPSDLVSAAVALAKVGQKNQAVSTLCGAMRGATEMHRIELFDLATTMAAALSLLREPEQLRGLSAAIDGVDRWWTPKFGSSQ